MTTYLHRVVLGDQPGVVVSVEPVDVNGQPTRGEMARLEDFPRGSGPIGSSWRDALGDPRRIVDWTVYFEREVTGQPCRQVLETWWLRLLLRYRQRQQIFAAARLVQPGEFTTYGDISLAVYGHARGG